MVKKKFVQSFSNYEPDFVYNAEKGILEQVGQVDVQAKIDSYKDTCLDNILDRFLNDDLSIKNLVSPNFDPDDDEIVDLYDNDFMDVATNISDLEDYGFDPSLLQQNVVSDNDAQKEVVESEKEIEQEEKL